MMKVLFCTPSYLPSVGGNVTTVRRITEHLSKLSVDIKIVVTQPSHESVEKQAYEFRPDIIHAFHAFKAGVIAHTVARNLSIPLVISLTGTDVHSDLNHTRRRDEILQVLTDASFTVAFTNEMVDCLNSSSPSLAGKLKVIPQGVWLPNQEKWDVRECIGVSREIPLLLLVANIRKVKRIMMAIECVQSLRRLGPDAQLLLVGDILEANEWRWVKTSIQRYNWIHHLGAVQLERMKSVYQSSDIIINTSQHESMSNALLEAMWLRRPVLATAVPDNTSTIKHELTGLLFHEVDDFAIQAMRLLNDSSLRKQLVNNAKSWVQKYCDPEKEALSYKKLYEKVLKI